MAETPINFIFSMQVYPYDLMVSIAQSDEELKASLRRKYHIAESDLDCCNYSSDTSMGHHMFFSNNASLVRLRKLPSTAVDFGQLAHEIFHVASFVMDSAGMRLQLHVSEEAYAYLIQFLTKTIYEKLNKFYK